MKQLQVFDIGYKKTLQVFTDEKENELVEYIIGASEIYFWLSPKEIQKLAYELAEGNSLNMTKYNGRLCIIYVVHEEASAIILTQT